MSIEESLEKVIEKLLSNRALAPYPVFANRADTAKLLGISPQTLDRMFSDGTLNMDKHTRRFTAGGNIMYFLPQIIADLKPDGATVMILGKAA